MVLLYNLTSHESWEGLQLPARVQLPPQEKSPLEKYFQPPPQKKKKCFFFFLKTQIENREEMDSTSPLITTSASSDVAASLYKKNVHRLDQVIVSICLSVHRSIYLYIIIAHPSTRCVNNINKLSITWIKSICRSIVEQRTRGVQT